MLSVWDLLPLQQSPGLSLERRRDTRTPTPEEIYTSLFSPRPLQDNSVMESRFDMDE
jgi:hypothetical protein